MRRPRPVHQKAPAKPTAGNLDPIILVAAGQLCRQPKVGSAGSVPAGELQPHAEGIGPSRLGMGALGALGMSVSAVFIAGQTSAAVLVGAGSTGVRVLYGNQIS